MAGQSKWHQIRHKKGAEDAKRGKIFTRHAHLITIAARQGGGDPEMNPALRLAIENAKKDNVPAANIERAIKRGTGELKDAAEITEETYEGYGPAGVAFIVEALTDNKNRTFTNIRTIFSKRGGSLGESGSVRWMFERKGIIQLNTEGKDIDALELAAIDAGCEDVEREDGMLLVTTAPNELMQVVEALKKAGVEPEQAELALIPKNTVSVSAEDAQKVMNLIDALEEDPDVSNVHTNAIFPEES